MVLINWVLLIQIHFEKFVVRCALEVLVPMFNELSALFHRYLDIH